MNFYLVLLSCSNLTLFTIFILALLVMIWVTYDTKKTTTDILPINSSLLVGIVWSTWLWNIPLVLAQLRLVESSTHWAPMMYLVHALIYLILIIIGAYLVIKKSRDDLKVRGFYILGVLVICNVLGAVYA